MNFVIRDLIIFWLFLGVQIAPSHPKKNKNKANNWWNLANVDLSTSTSPVDEVQLPPHGLPLTKKQQKIIYKNPGSMGVIVRAAKMAVEECGRQFASRRWNCPSSTSYHGGHIFGGIVKKGFKETAFLHALTSAALTHSVARACSEGTIHTCSCGSKSQRRSAAKASKKQNCGWPPLDSSPTKENMRSKKRPKSGEEKKKKAKAIPPTERNFQDEEKQQQQQQQLFLNQVQQAPVTCQWGGCSDNSEFGLEFSREFIDGSEKDKDLRCAVNLHNNEAGRQQVNRLLQMDCKCHGMSGSCSIKTCWMKISSFSRVASLIMEKYKSARKVDQENGIKKRTRFNIKPTKLELVYFEDSPEFCEPDASLHFPGIEGRICNASSYGDDRCEHVCCDRGFRREKFEVIEKCNCSFQWCCKVRCDRCTNTRERHICL